MRIQSIDIARGLCIVLVVWGHNAQFTDTDLNHALWSVRMPMMFFVAGSFMDVRQSWLQLTLTKADALIKPFVVMALLQAPWRMAIGATDPKSLLIGLAAGGGYYLPWIYYLWYLPHLWLLFMVGHLMIVTGRIDRMHSGNKALLLLSLLYSGTWLMSVAPAGPYKIEALPRDLAFFLIGYCCKASLPAWRFSWGQVMGSLTTLMLAQVLLNMDAAQRPLLADTAWRTLSSVSGIMLVMTMATGLSRFDVVHAFLARCGRDSLFILLFHWPLQTLSVHAWTRLLGPSIWSAGVLSWLSSVCLSLMLATFVRSMRWTASLYLPMKQVRKMGFKPLWPRRPSSARTHIVAAELTNTVPRG
jgi:fucose 4-O-acetylase-like acetyltransferase